MNTRDRNGEVKRAYKSLFTEVARLLFEADPMGINFDENTDEYEPEAGTILPRLRLCTNAEQVCVVVREEFDRWFSSVTAVRPEQFQEVSDQIWAAWQAFQESRVD